MTHLLGLILAILPAEPWPVDYVGAVEFNAVYDDDGFRRFSQTLWVEIGGPNEIRDWRWWQPNHAPVGGWMLFHDEKLEGNLRAVRVIDPEPFRSRTRFDPETERRTIQPARWRQRLMKTPD